MARIIDLSMIEREAEILTELVSCAVKSCELGTGLLTKQELADLESILGALQSHEGFDEIEA
jgi:hypothetical protein